MLIFFILLGIATGVPLCFLFDVSLPCRIAIGAGLSLGGFVGWLFLYILGLFLFSLCIDMKKPRTKDHPFVRFLIAETVRLVCQLGRVKIVTEGLEKMPAGRFLLISNHRSMFDPLVSLVAFKKFPMAFVTKPENLRLPLVGRIIRYCCFLPIDRENPRSAIRAINSAAELIKTDTLSVGIYPEGTRNKGEAVLLPFHSGVLMIAQKAGVPVVAVTAENTEKVVKNFPLRKTVVKLTVCDVIPAEAVASARTDDLGNTLYATMEKQLEHTYAKKG
ncbi:MAG: 1-acyl-sn-glycerol-3-phosphate acyltransferase [Clostridia bacterium]|nr:1-acyl-sn-glycerol-3-phosphate acyltransferase [Clostridia bacterium]MBR6553247.1 1-acyl-sn-glycerol-3-phosphate acyltransferase [Clostridia bacterium]